MHIFSVWDQGRGHGGLDGFRSRDPVKRVENKAIKEPPGCLLPSSHHVALWSMKWPLFLNLVMTLALSYRSRYEGRGS